MRQAASVVRKQATASGSIVACVSALAGTGTTSSARRDFLVTYFWSPDSPPTRAEPMAYYNLDAILTDAQKAPCTFELKVPGLGFVGGNVGADVDQGTKVELPLWLGEMLAVSKPTGDTSLASMDMPTALGQRVMNALKADPKSVELRAQAQHFYSLGIRMLDLFEDDEVTDVLMDTFKKRAVEIADKASNTRSMSGDPNDFVTGMDETERTLFRAAHDGQNAVKKWYESTQGG